MMTNANVENSQRRGGTERDRSNASLKDKGGEIKVLAPADNPVVKHIVGGRKLLASHIP